MFLTQEGNKLHIRATLKLAKKISYLIDQIVLEYKVTSNFATELLSQTTLRVQSKDYSSVTSLVVMNIGCPIYL